MIAPEIAKILIVTTAHLTPAERDRLSGEDGLPARAQLVGEFGMQVWVPPLSGILTYDSSGADSDSAGLTGCLKLARELGCRYVLFDRDAEAVDGVPLYDDEGNVEVAT